MPVVPTGLISDAMDNFVFGYKGSHIFWTGSELRDFHTALGISSKQWRKFNETGKLKVSRKVLARIEVVAHASPDHQPALLKAVEAKYETGRSRRNHEA